MVIITCEKVDTYKQIKAQWKTVINTDILNNEFVMFGDYTWRTNYSYCWHITSEVQYLWMLENVLINSS